MNAKKEKIKDRIADSLMATILFVIYLLITLQLSSQTPYPQFQNPSLEDAIGVGISPWGYSKCTTGGPSSPDIQPGIWNVFLQPSDGFSYVGFICRANNTWESFTTQLNAPLWGGTQYAFLIDLASSDKYFGYNDSAATLKIWGGDANCDKQYLLWESTPVNNINYWRTDTASFVTREKSITHLTFEPGYTNQMPYKGNILIDNLRPYNGTIVGIEEIQKQEDFRAFDLLGRKYSDLESIPFNTIYIYQGKKYMKLQK